MITPRERVEIYRLAKARGFTVLFRPFVELRPPGHEPGEDVYIMSPRQAMQFLEEGLEESDDTVH